MSAWKSLPFSLLDTVPAAPGVFAVYRSGRLLFIGQSTDLLLKFRQLRYVNRGTADIVARRLAPLERCEPETLRLKYKLSKTVGDWLRAELRLVSRLAPPMNQPRTSWNTLLLAVRDPAEAARRRIPPNTCVKCGKRKKPYHMASKTWCKMCRSYHPREWAQTGEKLRSVRRRRLTHK